MNPADSPKFKAHVQNLRVSGFSTGPPSCWLIPVHWTQKYRWRLWYEETNHHTYTVSTQTCILSLQLLANVMLYLCAAMVGVMSYYMEDRKYRTAFLEARQSLEVKLTLEEQSTQQVSGANTHTRTHTYTLLNEIIHFLIWGKHTQTCTNTQIHLWGRTLCAA